MDLLLAVAACKAAVQLYGALRITARVANTCRYACRAMFGHRMPALQE